MGTGFNKDADVDLYFELKKPFYYAGQWVEGMAYLVAKANIFYNALYVRLEGHQYCHWSEGGRKNRRSYTGNRQTYEQQFMISKSDNGFAQGHYSYPFSFQLPMDMTGSYTVGNNTNFYIRYPLQVRLVDFQGKKDPQIYTYNMTVLQPPRAGMQSLQGSKSTNPQVCCCVDQGRTALTVSYDKNMAQSGDVLNLNIDVDNRQCQKGISRVEVELTRHLFVQSNGGASRNWKTVLAKANTPSVNAGGMTTLPLSMNIPVIVNPTAIGTIVANYYTVDVESNVQGCICCCGDNHPKVQGHIVVTTQTPEIIRKPQMTSPQGWNPIVAPLVVYNSAKPFIYQHNHKLRGIRNRAQYPN